MTKRHRSQIRRERNANGDIKPSATLPYVRVSVQKACFILDATRGKNLQTAPGIVTYSLRYAFNLVRKLLESAAANVENNNGMDPAKLYIEECYANQGPTMKGVRPRAQGRAYGIEKRMSHITIVPSGRQKANMGQRANLHDLRIGVIKGWDSKWYTEVDSADCLAGGYNIRKFPRRRLFSTGISKIEIERVSDRVKIIIYTAKPSVMIGEGGSEIEKLKEEVQKLADKRLFVDIREIKCPDRDAQLVAESIVGQLESRVSFRHAMKSITGGTMRAGIKGTKTTVAGRLGSANMARTEFYSEGITPLQILRTDIDHGFAEADITYGKIGVKVWIYKGEVPPARGNKEGSDK